MFELLNIVKAANYVVYLTSVRQKVLSKYLLFLVQNWFTTLEFKFGKFPFIDLNYMLIMPFFIVVSDHLTHIHDLSVQGFQPC